MGLPIQDLPDEVLLAGYGQGDPELAVAFVRRFQARVFGVALAIAGDPSVAEEVAQQAFVRAWQHAGAYDPRRAPVGGWLGVITRNLALDAARVRPPAGLDPSGLLERLVDPAPASDPEGLLVAAEAAGTLREALRSLPREQATAVVLAGMVGLSASQIAEREGIPLGTAKTRVRTALRRLRAELGDRRAHRA